LRARPKKTFSEKADAAFEDLKRRSSPPAMNTVSTSKRIRKVEVIFEKPEEAKLVISPNPPVRENLGLRPFHQFQLGWNESRQHVRPRENRRRSPRRHEPVISSNSNPGHIMKTKTTNLLIGRWRVRGAASQFLPARRWSSRKSMPRLIPSARGSSFQMRSL